MHRFLLLLLALVALPLSAQQFQFKSVDVKLDLRGETGVGAGVTVGIGEQFEVAPSASFYFPDDYDQMYQIDLNVHYLLSRIPGVYEVYPLVGVGMFHTSYDVDDVFLGLFNNGSHKESNNDFLVNLGGGARYHINSHFAVFLEEKYQLVRHYNNNFLSLGMSYTF